MHKPKQFFLASIFLAGFGSLAQASTDVDRIEFEAPPTSIVEFETRVVSLMVLNADFCNSTLPGQLGNCALSATLRIDAQSSGLDACFLGNNGCSDDPIVVGVGGPVLIAVTSLGAAPSNQSLRIRASFENINHSSSSATLDLAVVPPPFLTGPSSVRVIRGRSASLAFAAEHPGGTSTVAVSLANVANGLTATATPSSLPVGVDATTIAVAAAATLAAGSYGLDVVAAVAGFASETDHVTAVVVDPIVLEPQLSRLEQLTGIRLGTTARTVGVDVVREPGVTGAITYSVARNLLVNVEVSTAHGGDPSLTLTRTALATSGSSTTVVLRGTVDGVVSSVSLRVSFL